MREIDDLQVELCRAELEEARAEFSKANTRLQKARNELAAALSPFAVGDFAAGADGARFRIDAIVPVEGLRVGLDVMLRAVDPKGEIHNLVREAFESLTAGEPFTVEGETA